MDLKMESNFDLLINQCKIFKTSVENIKIGAKSHQNSTIIEEKVIQLKQLNKFVSSKLQAINVDSQKENKVPIFTDDDIIQMRNDLLDKVCHEQIHEKMCRAISSGKTVEDLKTNPMSSPEIEVYKQKILEMLINLSNVNKELERVVTKQQKVLQQTLALKMELKKAQIEYKNKMAEHKEKSSKGKDSSMSEVYKDKLAKLEKYVSKINFMHVLISRLLIYGMIIWGENKKCIPIFERVRLPVTLDDFKKNSLEKNNLAL